MLSSKIELAKKEYIPHVDSNLIQILPMKQPLKFHV